LKKPEGTRGSNPQQKRRIRGKKVEMQRTGGKGKPASGFMGGTKIKKLDEKRLSGAVDRTALTMKYKRWLSQNTWGGGGTGGIDSAKGSRGKGRRNFEVL